MKTNADRFIILADNLYKNNVGFDVADVRKAMDDDWFQTIDSYLQSYDR